MRELNVKLTDYEYDSFLSLGKLLGANDGEFAAALIADLVGSERANYVQNTVLVDWLLEQKTDRWVNGHLIRN